MNDATMRPPHKLSPEERQQQLVDWNATQADFPALCVHQLFEQQVIATPHAIALIDGDQQLTYQALNGRANQLAHRLQTLGVQPDDLVGLCIERSIDLFVSLLGIFKAGGAYVPLDASYPPERIAYMLQDSGARVLLTTTTQWQQLTLPATAAADCQIVCLDEANNTPGQAALDNPISLVQPHNLAYCIYTSGSTGNPKGALMEHRSLVNMLWWHRQTRPPVQGVKTLQFCAVSFDFSFHEIFATLCLGGTLVLVTEEIRRNGVALAEFIRDQAIEKLFLPVTALVQLAEAAQDGPLPTRLREVITTGELLQITPAIANLFRHTGAMLHNHYGATEFQDATTLTLQGDPADWPSLVPVGRPLHNVQVYILDEQGEPVTVGEAGEFCIGGVGVARGYLNRPDLNEQKFVPNPFASGLLYKTGDLARYQRDGMIEHLGRIDQQVKIRGFRVELGEVEAALRQHPAVRECAVVAREDAAGAQQLVGYLVPAIADKNEPTDQLDHTLWVYLQAHLPEYMVPTRFVQVETMPLTPSGKLDRRALPAPVWTRPALATALVNPSSAPEARLAQIWRKLLGLEHVGIHDNFFELGGTSLLLTQLHKAVVAAFAVKLAAVALFQYPTIHTLAQHLDERVSQTRKASERPESIKSSSPPLKNSRQTLLAQQRVQREQHRTQAPKPNMVKMAALKTISQPSTLPRVELFPSVGEYPVYDAYLYHLMTNDEYRNQHYRAAINQMVQGKTVVDIGTGQDAILAIFCAQAGAKKIYALERSHNAYALAVARIQELGLADKIQVIYGEATELELPEPVDICLSEVIGNIGGSEGAAVILNDARKFLKPGGLMIPEKCVTLITAVSLPDEVLYTPSFGEYATHYTQKVFDAVGYPFDVRICMNHLPKTNFLAEAAIFEDLDFTHFVNPEDSVAFSLRMTSAGRLDGFLLWINLYVAENKMIDSLAYKCNWSPVFFPAFEPGIAVCAGDVVEAVCQRRLNDNQINPDYLLQGRVMCQSGQTLEFSYASNYQHTRFKQTPFYQQLFAQL